MEEYNRYPEWLVTAVGVLLIVAGIALSAQRGSDNAMPAAVVLPTLQPTPALTVPTAWPTVEVVYERSPVTNITVNQNVNVCVGICR